MLSTFAGRQSPTCIRIMTSCIKMLALHDKHQVSEQVLNKKIFLQLNFKGKTGKWLPLAGTLVAFNGRNVPNTSQHIYFSSYHFGTPLRRAHSVI